MKRFWRAGCVVDEYLLEMKSVGSRSSSRGKLLLV